MRPTKHKMVEDETYVVEGMTPLYPLFDAPVGQIIYDQLLTNGDNSEALVDSSSGRCISYQEILSKTCSLAESLRKCGYNENTIISICSENSIEFFVPVIAALYIGATIAPLNHNYTETEMVHCLQISTPQIVFCSKQMYPKFLDLKRRLKFIKKVLIIDGVDDENYNSVKSFIARNLSSTERLYRFSPANVNVNSHLAFIMYSSGTTGLPKGVMITQRNVLAQLTYAHDPQITPQEEGRCTLGLLPFFHAYGLFVGLISIYKFVKIIIIQRFEEKLFLKTIEKYRITGLHLVPPLALLLAKSPLVGSYDLSSVKHVGCGAAPLKKETEEVLKQRLKVDGIRQGYGLSEATLSVTRVPINVFKSGSTGKVLPYNLCKIRDPSTGRSLGPYQVGEICVKGLIVMKGYYRNEAATKNTFTRDGWLLTGDLGYYDEEDFFFIVGRIKELIKYKGFQVAPAEIEAILLANPKIKDAAVIGVPNEACGELPLAFIVPNPILKITAEEVQQFVAGKVSSHKRLRGGVIFISEIPKNPSGKILRRKLQEFLKTCQKAKY